MPREQNKHDLLVDLFSDGTLGTLGTLAFSLPWLGNPECAGEHQIEYPLQVFGTRHGMLAHFHGSVERACLLLLSFPPAA